MVLKVLFLISGLNAIAFAMIVTSMSPIVLAMGGSPLYRGVLESTCALVALIAGPLCGSLGDIIGRKKVFLQSLMVASFANGLVVMVYSLETFFICKVLCAFANPFYLISMMKNLVDDNVKKDDRAGTLNKLQALGGGTFIVGALISAQLSEYQHGMKYIYLLISVIYLLNSVLVAVFVENRTEAKPANPNPLKNLTTISWSKYWKHFTTKCIIEYVFGVFQFNMGIILTRQFHLSSKWFGYVISCFSVFSIIATVAMIKGKAYFYPHDERGCKRLLHAIILLSLSALGQSAAPSLPFFFLSILPFPLARVIAESTYTEVILAMASSQEKGAVMSTFGSSLALSGLVAPLSAGAAAQIWGNSMSSLVCATPLLFAGYLQFNQKSKTK